MKQNGFSKTDGIILAVISKEPQIDLCKYISMVDAYYRIVPTFEELSGTIERLQKNGILLYDNGKLLCTEKSKKLLTGKNRLGMTSFMTKVSEKIIMFPYEDECEVKYAVQKTEFDEAYKLYKNILKSGRKQWYKQNY